VAGTDLSSGANVEDESLFDWASMVLGGLWEEEGRRDVPSETQMYSQLGLIEEDETEENRRDEGLRGGATNFDESDHINSGDHNTDQPCEGYLPGEKRVKYDKINPSVQSDSLFPNMKEFRIAMRQYAIKHEFELGIDVTSTSRYVGYCKGGDCPWRIYAREKKKGLPTIVVSNFHFFVSKHFTIFCCLINRETTICMLLSCMACILAHLVARGRRQPK
jgi:hypothetical protein